MRETRGALGRLATKSFNFWMKDRTKSIGGGRKKEKKVNAESEADKCLMVHREHVSDRDRQTDRQRM